MSDNQQQNTSNIRKEGLFEFSKGKLLSYLGHSSYVEIPVGTSIIGGGAFKDNHFLEVLYVPKSVLSVRGGAFENCINLTKVIVEGKSVNWAKGCFKGCDNLKEISYTKQSQIDMGGCHINGYLTINLKENNVSTTPTLCVNEVMMNTVFDLVSTYYQGEFENTVSERLEIFIDLSLRQHQASINLWENQREEWYKLLRLQKISYDKLIQRQKKELFKYLQVGIDESYDCLDNQAKEYKELLKTQLVDRKIFLDEFKEKQTILNKNILGENYQTTSWGFEDNVF